MAVDRNWSAQNNAAPEAALTVFCAVNPRTVGCVCAVHTRRTPASPQHSWNCAGEASVYRSVLYPFQVPPVYRMCHWDCHTKRAYC